jgi:predicted lipoprotein with Yx(FWY)xxD motif
MGGGRAKAASVASAMVAVVLTVAVGGVGVATAGVATAGVAKVRVSDTLSGSVVTNARGFVLFTFPRGGHRLTRCLRTKTCIVDWPPVTTTGRPVAGPGLNPRLLSTIPYRGRVRAVTYAGWPLHTYKFAYSAQTSVMNIGIRQYGGNWYALDGAGRIVK